MRQAQTLTDAQLRRVLHYCRSRRHPLRDETIILTSFYAGLRAIEIAALKYADVYDEQDAVRDQFTLRATQSKGGRTRTVYIGSKLKRALKEYQASIVRNKEDMPLFPSQKGGHFSANTMCQLFLDIYKTIGLQDASSHSGRRTYITKLANKGVGVRLLAELAGHSHISTAVFLPAQSA